MFTLPNPPVLHLPRQNWADCGTYQIKVDPTQPICRRLACVCIDEYGDEAVGLWQRVDVTGDALRRLLVLLVPRRPREVSHLQLDRRHLRRGAVRAPLGRVPPRISGMKMALLKILISWMYRVVLQEFTPEKGLFFMQL